MKCPTCGADNDPANRFCDQCGSRLDAASAPAATPIAEQPTVAAATCPNCGSAILPGEAFCDECGTPLNATPVPVNTVVPSADAPTMIGHPAPTSADVPTSADAPTMIGMPAPTPSQDASSAQAGSICPACGHQNLPGDQFCDNCGAALTAVQPTIADIPTAPAPAATVDATVAPAADETPAPTVDSTVSTPEVAEQAPVTEDPELTAPPVVETPDPVVGNTSTSASTPSADESASQPSTAAAAPVAAPSQGDQQGAYEAERQRFQDEIARQDQIIAQFEQMQTMFGTNSPPAVVQGLADARAARDRAQADLDALQPPAPAVDPAEVARLQDEIARQDQIIAQFEQMQTMFGANTPPAVVQGLNDARLARAEASDQLTALGASVSPAAVPSQTAAPAAVPADQQASAPAPQAEPAAAPVAAAPAPPVEATPQAPAPQVARLVVESNGTELPLPTDKAEIIIGREDPISGIFPEVDLTPHGGEGGGVSRQHAKLIKQNGGWAVVDLNSTNYTRVDGNKLEPNVPVPVGDGSRIQLGRIVVVLRQ